MKSLFVIVAVLFLLAKPSEAQDKDSIYSFLNQVHQTEFLKSPWGAYYMERPYVLDSSVCEKLSTDTWTHTDARLKEEFCSKCNALKNEDQQHFKWDTARIKRYIIVKNRKDRLAETLVKTIPSAKINGTSTAALIRLWNKTPVKERLVNYSSIPVFSNDGNYVLFLRGQDVQSEGGWDTLYIYKRTARGWEIWESFVVAVI